MLPGTGMLIPKHSDSSGLPMGAILGAQPQPRMEKQLWSSGSFQLRVARLRSKRSFSPGKEFIPFTTRRKEVN